MKWERERERERDHNDFQTSSNIYIQLSSNSLWFDSNFSPRNTGHYLLCVNAILVLDGEVEQRIKKRVREQVWLESQLDKFCVLGVVIMLLRLYSWVWHGYGLHIDPELVSRFCYKGSELIDWELFGELVEDPELTRLGWVCNGNLNALNSVTYVEISPSLYLSWTQVLRETFLTRNKINATSSLNCIQTKKTEKKK